MQFGRLRHSSAPLFFSLHMLTLIKQRDSKEERPNKKMTRRKKGASKLVWFLSCSVFPCSSNNVKSNFFGRYSVVCPTADKRPMQRRTHAARYHLTYKLDFFFSQDLGKFPFILYSQRADLSTTTKEPSEQKKKKYKNWLISAVCNHLFLQKEMYFLDIQQPQVWST